jgi:hypothetical protein
VAAALAALTATCGSTGDAARAGSVEAWCDVVAASNQLDDEFDAVDTADAVAIEAVLDRIDELGDRFRRSAPTEIESQVVRYAEANSLLVQIFADADFRIDDLDTSAINAAIDAVTGIDAEIDAYTIDECGEALGPDDT